MTKSLACNSLEKSTKTKQGQPIHDSSHRGAHVVGGVDKHAYTSTFAWDILIQCIQQFPHLHQPLLLYLLHILNFYQNHTEQALH